MLVSEPTRSTIDERTDGLRVGSGAWWGTVGEVAFGMIVLLAGTLGPIYQIRMRLGPFPDPYDKDQLSSIILSSLYVVAALLGMRVARRLNPVPLIAAGILMVLLVSSSFWSYDKVLSATNALQAAVTLVVPWYLAKRWSVRQLARIAWAAMTTGVLISMFAVWRGWPTALDGIGDWAGVYFNRNSLGVVAALCAVLGVWLAIVGAPSWSRSADLALRLAAGTSVLVALATLHRSGSKTPLAAGAIAVGVWAGASLVARAVPERRRTLVLWSGLAGSALLLVFGFGRIAQALGSDPTLQGRTELWGYLVGRIRERPLTGDGWMATYTTWDYYYWGIDHLSTNVQYAHNGFLEVGVGAGLLALAAVLALTFFGLDTALRPFARGVASSPALLIAVFFLAANSAETFVGAHHSVWVLFLAACTFRWTPRSESTESDLQPIEPPPPRAGELPGNQP